MKTASKKIIALSLLVSCIISSAANMTGCGRTVQAEDLMSGIESESVQSKAPSSNFSDSMIKSYANMFKEAYKADKNENVIISPLSVTLALAMTANGADGQTKEEMESVLGGIPVDELNEYLLGYVSSLPSEEKSRISLANSIWFRDDESLRVKEDFLKTNANYFGAEIKKTPFNKKTVDEINSWVDKNTDGMIKEIVNELSPDEVMHLINAVAFDAEWESPYMESNVEEATFTSKDGDEKNVEMMFSNEIMLIDNGNASGFIKNYCGRKYGFAALLPNENINIDDYIEKLDLKDVLDNIKNSEELYVDVGFPKFNLDYSKSLNDLLASLGMPTAFDPNNADFSNMGSSNEGNIYIGEVTHKTHIAVDTKGTKAAAATDVEMKNLSISIGGEEPFAVFDRPFFYMIIDNSTFLPIFMGTVTDIGE